jgi:hypothetical protein
MRAHEIVQFDWVILVLVIGAAISLAFHLALRGRAAESKGEQQHPGAGESIEIQHHPIPIFLWLLYIGMALFAVIYVVRVWLTGMSF